MIASIFTPSAWPTQAALLPRKSSRQTDIKKKKNTERETCLAEGLAAYDAVSCQSAAEYICIFKQRLAHRETEQRSLWSPVPPQTTTTNPPTHTNTHASVNLTVAFHFIILQVGSLPFHICADVLFTPD